MAHVDRAEYDAHKADCAKWLDAIRTELGSVGVQVTAINRGLFISNGHESLQAKVNRHDGYFRIIAWLMAALITAVLAVGVPWLFSVGAKLNVLLRAVEAKGAP